MANFKVTAPDGTVLNVAAEDQATALAKAKTEWGRLKMRAEIDDDPISRGARNFANELPWHQKLAAGYHQSFRNVGRGIGQLTGLVSDEEVTEAKKLDAPLLDTGAGMTGRVAGDIAQIFAPGAALKGAGAVATAARAPQVAGLLSRAGQVAINPATYGGAAAQGGAFGFVQPVAEGDSRIGNTALGVAGGVGGQALGRAIPTVYQAGKSLVAPFTRSGQEQIAARTIARFAGDQSDDVVRRMAAAQQIVPGSAPTAADVAQNAGISQLQRSMMGEPQVADMFAQRALDRNAARVVSLKTVSGEAGDLAAAEAARTAASSPLYKQAIEAGVDQEMAKILKPQIKNLMERKPAGVVEAAKELARINGDVMGKEGSVKGMHWMKLAVDDMLSSGKQTGIGAQKERALLQFKDDLLTVLDDLSPTYKQARLTHAQMSEPINQMQIGQRLMKQGSASMENVRGEPQLLPAKFNAALKDEDALARTATKFNKASFEKQLTPQQAKAIRDIADDLARESRGADLGKALGSNTAQNLAAQDILRQIMGPTGLPMSWAEGALLPGLLGQTYTRFAEPRVQQQVTRMLLDPAKGASVMRGTRLGYTPNPLLMSPAYLGGPAGAVGLLNAHE